MTTRDESIFDASKPDFAVGLLPFCNHPRFERFTEHERSRTLSVGWIVYNAKTIEIETHVVNPLCCDVLQDKLPGLNDGVCKEIISETMVDESYHVLMTVNSSNLTMAERCLDVRVPTSSLVKSMQRQRAAYQEPWQKTLVQFATTVVSEVFISDYLTLLSNDATIQPLHRMVVDAHRKDESVHNVIFLQLAKLVYSALSRRQREFFAALLPKPVHWFADHDLMLWAEMFDLLCIDDTHDMLEDCRQQRTGQLDNIDYSGIIKLAGELGITDLPVGRDAFIDAGLLA